jgi:hypothetical protein
MAKKKGEWMAMQAQAHPHDSWQQNSSWYGN